MARGWESKAVEAQQAEAAESRAQPKAVLTSEQITRLREREGVLLSRKRVLQQLATVDNPRHRTMLEAALADLDARLTKLE